MNYHHCMPGRSEGVVGWRSIKVSSDQFSASLVDPLQPVLPLLDLLVLVLTSSALQLGFIGSGRQGWLLLHLLLLLLVEIHIDIVVHSDTVIVDAILILDVAGHADHHRLTVKLRRHGPDVGSDGRQPGTRESH